MKKNVKIALILCIICVVCSALLAVMYAVTKPIIAANEEKTQLSTITEIFEDYDAEKSETVTDLTGHDSAIQGIIYARDKDGNDLGTLYTVYGTNNYGSIKLMVAVVNGKVHQVEFLSNDQSYSSTVASFLSANYPSSPDSTKYIGVIPDTSTYTGGDVTAEDNSSVDTSCGATFGAKLIQSLVSIALEDAKGGAE